jgi:hypothetical protein
MMSIQMMAWEDKALEVLSGASSITVSVSKTVMMMVSMLFHGATQLIALKKPAKLLSAHMRVSTTYF